MGNMIAIDKWLGLRGEPLNPEEMQFTTREGKSCRRCLFESQSALICARACKVAEKAGMPWCETGNVIYVRKDTDPRQLTIEVK